MKRITITMGVIVAIFIMGLHHSNAQDKVTEKRLLGTWKLEIDIEEAMDEAEQELDEEDNVFGQIVIKGVSGLVEGIMGNIEIYFEFKKNGELVIMTNAFGEEDTDYANWEINSRGELYIDDSKNIDMDDDYWMMDGRNTLVAFEEGERDPSENIRLKKIE